MKQFFLMTLLSLTSILASASELHLYVQKNFPRLNFCRVSPDIRIGGRTQGGFPSLYTEMKKYTIVVPGLGSDPAETKIVQKPVLTFTLSGHSMGFVEGSNGLFTPVAVGAFPRPEELEAETKYIFIDHSAIYLKEVVETVDKGWGHIAGPAAYEIREKKALQINLAEDQIIGRVTIYKNDIHCEP